jgi:predicted esterase YcpF (UPF0227 family)
MKVYFSHGKESGPDGQKIQMLKGIALKNGLNTNSVDYTQIDNPDERAEKLFKILKKEREENDVVLVGSSMGGYVSLVVAEEVTHSGIFLMAPAVFLSGYKVQEFKGTYQNLEIIHGWEDEAVPVENVLKFAQSQKCLLHLVPDEHRLINSLDTVGNWFDLFLKRITRNNQ